MSGSSTLPTSVNKRICSPLRCRRPVRVLSETGHDNHFCLWPGSLDMSRRFEPVHPRHHDVRDHDLRSLPSREVYRVFAIDGFNHRDLRVRVQDVDHHRPDIVVVIDHQHLHGHGALSPRVATTVYIVTMSTSPTPC